MTFILPSFGASAISAVPGGGGFSNDYSLSYDGSDDNTQVTGLSLSGATSFSMWFNAQESVSGKIFSLLEQQPTSLSFDLGVGKFRVYLYDGSAYDAGAGGFMENQSTFTPTIYQWYHLAVTYDGSINPTGLKTYINGNLTTPVSNARSSTNFTSFNTGPSKNFEIGARTGNSRYNQQLMDEVAIFNSELSATNISDIYNSGAPTDISSLSPIAWWRMEEGSGTSVVNTANSGTYDATLVNGPTFSSTVPT